MKKLLIVSFIIASMFTNLVYAGADIATNTNTDTNTDTNTGVEAGITPDSILYTFDQLFEDMQLALTPDTEKQAELIMQFAKERMAEAKVMSEEQKSEYVKEAVEDYLDKLDKAQEKITEAIGEDKISEDSKQKLSKDLEEVTNETDEDVEGALKDDTKKELAEKVDKAYLVAKVVSGLDKEKVLELRKQDFGYGQIAKVFALAKNSGKTVDEIAQMIKEEDKGFGEIAKELGIQAKDLKPKVAKKKQKELEKALENSNEEDIKKFEERKEKINDRKEENRRKFEDRKEFEKEHKNERREKFSKSENKGKDDEERSQGRDDEE